MKYTSTLALTLLLVGGSSALAQAVAKPAEAPTAKPATESAPSKACPDCAARRRDFDGLPTRTFYLKYAIQPADMNEIATAMRQLLASEDKVFVVPSQDAILVRAISEDMALAERVINDLDRPRKTWRLTYTVSEMDGDKRLGAQHYSMVVASGQQSTLKQGDRVPILTGKENQMSYQDVGMSFSATLDELHDGDARLRSDVAQSSLAQPGQNNVDPVIRQSGLRGEAILAPGKPLILGSMDIPGSTHSLRVEALIEPLP